MVEVRSEDRVPARGRLGPPRADQGPRRRAPRVDHVDLSWSRLAAGPLVVERHDRTFAVAAVPNLDVDPGERPRRIGDARLAAVGPDPELIPAPEEELLAPPAECRRAHACDAGDLALRRHVEHDEVCGPHIRLQTWRPVRDAGTVARKPRICSRR